MSVMLFIALYLLGMFITAVALRVLDFTEEEGVLLVITWPLSLLVGPILLAGYGVVLLATIFVRATRRKEP